MSEGTNILLVGVGGQGILTLAHVIDLAALRQGLHLKQTEVHGMSQRGGAVQAHLRLSPRPIHSPLVARGEADLIIATEPIEAARHMEYLRPTGAVVSSTAPAGALAGAPPIELVLAELDRAAHALRLDSVAIAHALGNPRAQNFVLLGAAQPWLGVELDAIEAAIGEAFAHKPAKVAQLNLAALAAGLELHEGAGRFHSGARA